MHKLAILILATMTTSTLYLTAADFSIAEHLGRTWTRELVTFPANAAQLRHARDRHLLFDSQGKAVAYQALPGDKIGIVADLAPFATESWTFSDEVAATTTDLSATNEDGLVELRNSQVGVRLRTKLAPGEGPIAAIHVGDDHGHNWLGGSRMELPPELLATYRANIDFDGDVLAQVTCTLGDPAKPLWTWVLRLQAGEPVITVEESFTGADTADFVLDLGTGWQPSKLLYRYGKAANGKAVGIVDFTDLSAVEGSTKFVLEAWIHWWERQQQGNWFALSAGDTGPMVMIAAYRPSVWVDPEQPRDDRDLARVPLTAGDNGSLALQFRGRHAGRAWMIGGFDAAKALVGATDYDRRTGPNAPIPQQALVKHGHFPLDAVNREVLAWPRKERVHPCLYINEPSLAAFRTRYQPDPAEIQKILRTDIRPYQYDTIFYHYLGSNDEKLGEKLVEAAKAQTAYACRMIYDQDRLVYYGFAPHHQTSIIGAVTISDLVWNDPHLTDEDRDHLSGQLAFIAYAVSTADYWSPPRGYSANPNMTTTVASYQAALGAFLRDHPQADTWLGMGLAEMERQLTHWSDSEGGWLEAPHYAMASYDYYLGYLLMAHLAGYNDLLYGERMKKVITWFAKIATPPDSRLFGWRHNPPLGNTWKLEPCGEYGVVAALWRDKDPEFAANMAWMQLQQGNQATPGVGGFFATLAGYRKIYLSIPVEPKAPAWGSDLFPETTAVLRSHFPSDREAMVTMIAGNNHAHYDADSGSITFWGKGRLVCDDFGYEGMQPGWQHSMLITQAANQGMEMKVTELKSFPSGDYLNGVKGAWRRQLVLARDADPVGPNYLVIRDTLDKPAQAEWRLWFTATKVANTPDGALVTGADDVDTQVVLPLKPDGAVASNEQYASNTWGLGTDGRYGRHKWPQTSLTLKWEQGDDLLAVLYPRLRSDAPGAITALPGNVGVKVVSPAGTDYVFLARESTKASVDGIEFEGTSGIVQRRPGKPTVIQLFAPGHATADGVEAKQE